MKVKLTFDDEEEGDDTHSSTPLPSSTHLKWGAGLQGGSRGGPCWPPQLSPDNPLGWRPAAYPDL